MLHKKIKKNLNFFKKIKNNKNEKNSETDTWHAIKNIFLKKDLIEVLFQKLTQIKLF